MGDNADDDDQKEEIMKEIAEIGDEEVNEEEAEEQVRVMIEISKVKGGDVRCLDVSRLQGSIPAFNKVLKKMNKFLEPYNDSAPEQKEKA
jgi:hypothetical protein